MGRTATSLGASHGRPCFLDRSAPRVLFAASAHPGGAPLGSTRTCPLLPEPTTAPSASPSEATPSLQTSLELQEIWYKLSLPERCRFGRCFSGLVLKILGQQAARLREVKP
jgi:hypothetical protein